MIGSPSSMSRRQFFGEAAAGTASGMLRAGRPRKAWIVVEVGWEYNDEFHYSEGQFPHPRLHYDRVEADTECRRLCDAFFAEQTPEDFEIDWSLYRPDRASEPGFDESSVTWDEVRALGFPDPYFVLELTHPEPLAP